MAMSSGNEAEGREALVALAAIHSEESEFMDINVLLCVLRKGAAVMACMRYFMTLKSLLYSFMLFDCDARIPPQH